ncbi:MAG TPA: hypothetical protein VK421_19215 [Pyrinomonadaceae bacterium]|nr:hypothetical protein [Pyrinomonadaceae bacterium]
MQLHDQIQVKIIGSPEVVEEIRSDWAARPDQAQVVSSGPERDINSYRYGLTEIATIVGIIEGVAALGELGKKLYDYLKGGGDDARTIIVQTPLGRWEFVARDDLTEAEVQEILRKLAGVTP